MSLFLSMAAFALASSISPGPVNLLALSAGARHGWRASQPHVLGATLGFCLLLGVLGLGLQRVLQHWPGLTALIQLAGVAFLLFVAYRLARDDGRLDAAQAEGRPSLAAGALMQWLNPKAWLAALAGLGAFVADGQALRVGQFALIYALVCYGSIACWVWAGTGLGPYLNAPRRVRAFNGLMAALLVGCALYLLLAGSTGV